MDSLTPHNASASVGLAPAPGVRQRYTLRDLLTTAFYNRRIMLIAFLLPVLVSIGAALMTKPVYVADARLLILYGSEYLYRPTDSPSGYSYALDRNQIVEAEMQVLQSTTLLVQTLEKVGVDRVYPGTDPNDHMAVEAAARRMASDLKLTAIPQSNVLQLSYRNQNADVATQVLRTLIDGYLERRIAVFQRAPTPTAQADQDAFLARVRAAEHELAAFASAHDIGDPDEQMVLLLQQQSANRQARDAAAEAIKETTAKLEAIRQQLATIPPTAQSYADTDRSQTLQLLTQGLASLQLKRQDLASRYGESYPPIQELDRQIAETKAKIAAVPTREDSLVRAAVNPLYESAKAQQVALSGELAGLQAREAQLETAGAATDARIKTLIAEATTYRDLKRNRDVLDDAYRSFVKSAESAQLADVSERNRAANVRVVQSPEASAGLDMRRILPVAGIVVGLIAAVAVMAVCNGLREVFVTVRDVSVGLDLPVIAAVPYRRPRGWLGRKPKPAARSLVGA
jgi:uncharacterized protein involved in exopolysaccharide biosynthesis